MNNTIEKLTAEKLTAIISISYILVASILLIWYKALVSPSQIFIILTFSILVLTRLKDFLFSIPTALFLGYEYLGGLIPNLTLKAHAYLMPYFDQKFFGSLPTITLQKILFTNNSIHWYDYLAVFIYLIYSAIPVLALIIFWHKDKTIFKNYSTALLVLTCLSFLTYIFFPAMPPWMASQKGLIPPVTRIMEKVVDLKIIYQFLSANLVAAVPSLHAAYPWITFLFLYKKFKKTAFLFLPYVIAVWFSVVYLGEHYVFDILMGILYSTLIFWLINFLKGGDKNAKIL